jgi:hypothetical protein
MPLSTHISSLTVAICRIDLPLANRGSDPRMYLCSAEDPSGIRTPVPCLYGCCPAAETVFLLLTVQAITDSRGQAFGGDRLLDKADSRIKTPLVNNGVAGISGHEQDFQVRSALDGRFR